MKTLQNSVRRPNSECAGVTEADSVIATSAKQYWEP